MVMADTITFIAGGNATLPAGTAPVVDVVPGVGLLPVSKLALGSEDEFDGYVDEDDAPLPVKPGTGVIFIVSNDGTFAVQVDAALPAGDNNIGNVDLASAIPAGDNNIGNVDLASALPVGDNNIGNVDIDEDVSSSFDHGAKSDIGASAAQLTAASIPAKRGVQLLADIDNTAIVCIGNSAGVTFKGTVDATDGFPLSAGDPLLVPVDNVNKVHVISNDINQRIEWAAV